MGPILLLCHIAFQATQQMCALLFNEDFDLSMVNALITSEYSYVHRSQTTLKIKVEISNIGNILFLYLDSTETLEFKIKRLKSESNDQESCMVYANNPQLARTLLQATINSGVSRNSSSATVDNKVGQPEQLEKSDRSGGNILLMLVHDLSHCGG